MVPVHQFHEQALYEKLAASGFTESEAPKREVRRRESGLLKVYKKCCDKYHKEVVPHETLTKTKYAAEILKSKLLDQNYPID